MYKLLGIFVIFMAIGGCTTTQLTVREDSVIPDNRLSDAYDYAGSCVANGTDEIKQDDAKPEGVAGEEKLRVMEDCMNNMFIQFATTSYTVLETGADGELSPLYQSSNIEDITHYLRM